MQDNHMMFRNFRLAQAMMSQRGNQASPMGQMHAGMPDPSMMGSLGYTGQNQPPGQAFGMSQGKMQGDMPQNTGMVGPNLPIQQMAPMNIGEPRASQPPVPMQQAVTSKTPFWAQR